MNKNTFKNKRKVVEGLENLRCAKVFYTDSNGVDKDVGVYVDTLQEVAIKRLLTKLGMQNIDIWGYYTKVVSSNTYTVGDIVDDNTSSPTASNAKMPDSGFKQADNTLATASQKSYFHKAGALESVRRTVPRGAELADNPLFVDFE